MVLIGMLWKDVTSISWPSGTVVNEPQTSSKYTYTGFSAVAIHKTIVGPSSSAIYTYEVGAAATDTFFRKQNSNGSVAWAKNYSPIETTYKGVALTPDEASLFMIENGLSQTNLYKINAATGDFVMKYSR